MKKILSVIMVTAMILATMPGYSAAAFAGSDNQVELEKAITAVKKVVEIPAELKSFEYYYDEEKENGSNLHLSWTDLKKDKSISVTVTDSGDITSYYCYMPEFTADGLAKITSKQAQTIAEEHIKKFLPNAMGKFKLWENTDVDYGTDYRFDYKMYINDIPCNFINISIAVNKYVGKISSYRYNADMKDLTVKDYPSKEKAITKEEANKIYISQMGPKLKYLSDYDYSDFSLKIFTAYINEDGNKAIDANTGKIIPLYREAVYYRNATTNDEGGKGSAMGGGEAKFTKEELAEIQKVKNLIDKTEAEKIAKSLVGNLEEQKLISTALTKEGGPNQEYIWRLNYQEQSVVINAKDGSLVSFDKFTITEPQDKRDIGKEKAKVIADSYLEKVFGDKKDQVIWTNEDYDAEDGSNYIFVYTRQVNGICFDDNNVCVAVSKNTGEIESYRKTWYENGKFSELKGVIDKEKAFDKIADLGDFGLAYEKNAEGKIVLVYDFSNEESYILDAYKGIRLDYKGEVYKEIGEYTDISGNWAEKTIKELKNNGYYLEGDKFMPKEKTTQLDFFKYLYSPQQGYYQKDEDFYDMLQRNNIITKEEINANSLITRQEAAKFVARYMGVDKLAKEASVFKNMYTDKISGDYLGYASAAYAMGIMSGDAKGRFNGTETMNHAQTACLILNILNYK